MIDRAQLLRDCQRMLSALVDDLRTRCEEDPALDAPLRAQWQEARAAARTAQPYESWRESELEQVAAAWVLACVFVRFLEDNGLVDPPRLAGPGERRKLALDQHTLYFRAHPTDSDRDYLLHVFRAVAELPAVREVFDERHNPLWTLGPSGDGATALLQLFQRIDPDTGALVHDFTDPAWDTRFLGDLYQDLSENARKRYALLQTPDFVERFLLDRTLEPACVEFGFREVRLLDPTCGSGHFLLGAFARFFERWLQQEPGTPARELAQRALDQVAGVDLNPFAVAIARFRLLVAALRACGVTRLADAPAFHLHVAAGDSLLHGARPGEQGARQEFLLREDDPLGHLYHAEDEGALRRILGRRYHVVVGNPPYITPKDAAQNQAYRERYGSCHRQYSLAVPFAERFFDLAIAPAVGATEPAGFVGMITANSFMKREFGKKLVEDFVPRWDLTHVIDTSGAYIPGHGTPTVILLGRHRRPVESTIRAVMGIRGEPSTPDDPAQGLVWSAVVKLVDKPGSQSDFISVSDVPRTRFEQHPWSIGGGGAAELKQTMDEQVSTTLQETIESVGFFQDTHADEIFVQPMDFVTRLGLHHAFRPQVRGDDARDWTARSDEELILFPYDDDLNQWTGIPREPRWAWLHALRTVLWSRSTFGGGTYKKAGRPWFDYHQFPKDRARTPLSIAFAFVATHNHFVLDRGGKVFNRSAPVIKLPPGASEDEHLGLLGLLNSSTACFWMKQVFQPKSHASQRHHPDPARTAYEFAGEGMRAFPIPDQVPDRIVQLARCLDALAEQRKVVLASEYVLKRIPDGARGLQDALRTRWIEADRLRERMVALQEELDWTTYSAFGLIAKPGLLALDVPLDQMSCPRGQRPFEQLMGRRSLIREGGKEVALAESEAPPVGPLFEDLRDVWSLRRKEIHESPALQLIERAEYKRLWRDTDQNVREPDFRRDEDRRILSEWLLEGLEKQRVWDERRVVSVARLADLVRNDGEFLRMAEILRGRPDFDLAKLVEELVLEEGVPFLPVLRYKPSGLRKRAQWEETWRLQRLEDEIDARTELPAADPRHLSAAEATATKAREVGEISVPPKYKSSDFARSSSWKIRGKLDVPKERFVLYPGAERAADPTPVLGWAGWNHLEQAQALAAHYVEMQEHEGWPAERLTSLLAGLLELVPWLQQWHNDLDPTHQVRMGDYYAGFVESEARALGLTLDQLRSWQPAAQLGRGRARRRQTE